jgi:transketolase C-terminal domain/subunit
MTASENLVSVQVTLRDDDGEELILYAEGATVDEAVHAAELQAREMLSDESFVMTDWRAA